MDGNGSNYRNYFLIGSRTTIQFYSYSHVLNKAAYQLLTLTLIKMSRIAPVLAKARQMNVSMTAFLKVMYYFGYLPFTWTAEDDPNFEAVKFEVSKLKMSLMLAFDFALALCIPFYIFVWHKINLGDDFDCALLLRPSYYVRLNDGVVTTAISQIVFMAAALWMFWIHSYVGKLISPQAVRTVKNGSFSRLTFVSFISYAM